MEHNARVPNKFDILPRRTPTPYTSAHNNDTISDNKNAKQIKIEIIINITFKLSIKNNKNMDIHILISIMTYEMKLEHVYECGFILYIIYRLFYNRAYGMTIWVIGNVAENKEAPHQLTEKNVKHSSLIINGGNIERHKFSDNFANFTIKFEIT